MEDVTERTRFLQRFHGVLAKNRKTITAEWEKSVDAQRWKHDFYIKYRRQ